MRQMLALTVLVLAACGKAPDRADTSAATSDTGVMPGTAGMGGMRSGAMMDSMAAHMRGMDTMSATSVQAMLPMHRQMAANMIAQMNREMAGMNMAGNAEWVALMDSVRQDLVRTPDMSAEQLKAAMPGHQSRLSRLMQKHRDMMKDMKM